jgi:hypothetical protein
VLETLPFRRTTTRKCNNSIDKTLIAEITCKHLHWIGAARFGKEINWLLVYK